MKCCPVCGVKIPNENKFCSLACFRAGGIPEIVVNLHVGGDVVGSE